MQIQGCKSRGKKHRGTNKRRGADAMLMLRATPAKSTKLRRENLTLVQPSSAPLLLDSMMHVNTEWDLLDSRFMLVSPIRRFSVPLRITFKASSTARKHDQHFQACLCSVLEASLQSMLSMIGIFRPACALSCESITSKILSMIGICGSAICLCLSASHSKRSQLHGSMFSDCQSLWQNITG